MRAARQLKQDLEYTQVGRLKGAPLSFSGQPLRLEQEGLRQRPALSTDTRPAMRINQGETFGPVASAICARDYEPALAIANDVAISLCSGIVTRSMHHAADYQRRSLAGMVMINLPSFGVKLQRSIQ